MKIKLVPAAVVVAALLGFASAANATIVLTFTGLQDREQILNFYNGGLGGAGSGPGPSDGITFEADSIASISKDNGGTGNFNGAPFNTVLTFLSGPGDIMNVTGGFTTGFSFFYSSPLLPGNVTVWSGPNETGVELANIVLPTTPQGGAGCDQFFCPWVAAGVTFAGTAQSVDFTGTSNLIGFSAVTLGSASPTVPEPSTWAMMIVGFVGLAFAGFRAKRRNSALVA